MLLFILYSTGSSGADIPSANGSTSPASLTSSELIADNYNSSSEENLKYTQRYASLSRGSGNTTKTNTTTTNKKVNIYDNYDTVRSPAKQRVNKNGPIGEEQEVLINQPGHQLLVQINTAFDAKKMVASTESLTSYTSSNSAAKTSTTSHTLSQKIPSLQSSPNSFRTFKTASYSPATACKVDSYRTMPHNHNANTNSNNLTGTLASGYRNLSDVASTRIAAPVKRLESVYQKPLNLPVNELFKRYELRKNGVDSHGSSCSSSTVHSASETGSATPPGRGQQVPDFFFKDQKECNKFLAAGNKQNINIKQVVIGEQQQ